MRYTKEIISKKNLLEPMTTWDALIGNKDVTRCFLALWVLSRALDDQIHFDSGLNPFFTLGFKTLIFCSLASRAM